ncbi:hypothetical protein ACN27G_05990 [Plantactinospora sp. WMMB334]|uniref:hypothetical protein n=1 Tax=Plantactinospora sp. WMMB334 TaxID=3404119 RepID=UPI003B937BD9
MDVVVVEPDHGSFARVARALDAEATGAQWRREVAEELHEALRPGVAAVRGQLLGMPSGGGMERDGEPLRQAVAAQVHTDVRMAGSWSGARIRVRRIGMPRNFANAPKRLNSRRGWRHPVFRASVWTHQLGEPGWFDDPLRRLRPRLRAAAERALARRAERIGRRS